MAESGLNLSFKNIMQYLERADDWYLVKIKVKALLQACTSLIQNCTSLVQPWTSLNQFWITSDLGWNKSDLGLYKPKLDLYKPEFDLHKPKCDTYKPESGFVQAKMKIWSFYSKIKGPTSGTL